MYAIYVKPKITPLCHNNRVDCRHGQNLFTNCPIKPTAHGTSLVDLGILIISTSSVCTKMLITLSTFFIYIMHVVYTCTVEVWQEQQRFKNAYIIGLVLVINILENMSEDYWQKFATLSLWSSFLDKRLFNETKYKNKNAYGYYKLYNL